MVLMTHPNLQANPDAIRPHLEVVLEADLFQVTKLEVSTMRAASCVRPGGGMAPYVRAASYVRPRGTLWARNMHLAIALKWMRLARIKVDVTITWYEA